MFTCEHCAGKSIIESVIYVVRNSNVVLVTEDNKLVKNNPEFDFTNSELSGYFCSSCGSTVKDKNGYRINTESQLVRFLKGE